MKVLAFAASNSTTSINRALVGYAAQRLQALHPPAEVTFVDINDYEMPIYSPERQNADGIHPLAQRLFNEIGTADALIVSFAEYNGFVTAAWKNIYDWMSRIDQKVWQDKPFVLLAASPGRRAWRKCPADARVYRAVLWHGYQRQIRGWKLGRCLGRQHAHP
ncbi:NAD(P)H-dependent oxidoreductase [Yoonia sp. GPGPB17]|uniref:NADPH-dependent FMN reductase n=1 Tax=Yoonia sp. GPGPB17 TaxID=3026147 RepID=UPI0030C5034D